MNSFQNNYFHSRPQSIIERPLNLFFFQVTTIRAEVSYIRGIYGDIGQILVIFGHTEIIDGH